MTTLTPVSQNQHNPSLELKPVSLEQLHVLLDHLQGIVGYFDTVIRCV